MKISDAGKKVMDVLWHTPSITAKAIIRQLDPDVGWQDRTVKNLINRLLKKNAIGFKKREESICISLLLIKNIISNR